MTLLKGVGRHSVLLYFARLLDRAEFVPLHHFVRLLEVNALGPLAFRLLLLRQNQTARYEFRNSALVASDFHFLWSDLDSSLIVSDDEFSSSKFVKNYSSIRKAFPFLGEVEIFRESEIRRLNALYEENNGVYKFVRLIRKLAWMDSDAKNGLHDYHKEKAARSRRKVESKLSRLLDCESERFSRTVALKKWLASSFKHELSKLKSHPLVDQNRPDQYKSSYWDMDFDSSFSFEEVVTLFAIVPDGLDIHCELRPIVEAARSNCPNLAKIWRQNTEIELLHLVAWARSQEEIPEWYSAWHLRLTSWLKQEF
jgi:hypothetical protein